MQNELIDREELGNPMDAVKGGKVTKTKIASKPRTPKSTSLNKGKRQSLLVQILNGDILKRDFVLNNLTFIFFLLLLLMLMVAKGYYGKQLQKDINDLQTEVDAETAEYVEKKALLEEATARYRLVKKLEKRGLKETVNPAIVIRIKKEKDE
jgi:cell division protein FtsL